MQLLLLSNSTLPGEPFFTWPRAHVQAFLEERNRIAFVPYAAVEAQYDLYADKVAEVFSAIGKELVSLHREADPVKSLNSVDAIAVGGGNTFLLIRALYRLNLIKAIGEKVRGGMPYVGWSAGGNVACPTVMTTNDMPIVEPPSMRALGLVPFQINPHYTEATIPGHGGESRDQRIAEYLAVHPNMPVVGLREGSLLHLNGSSMRLEGKGMKLFRHGQEAKEIAGGTEMRVTLADA
ncbi:MAG: dipeptidase PepE [Flavobacteriales bacterium]|nr:dipeptidase PepE [Flavobacteriales bacterium]